MRIKQLDLLGFKSFVDRTVLTFSDGVSAIVGPNGCGKSNVVDAIRWALGEQSPKHLRGAAMEDVIFKGNDRRTPFGMAEVTLTFENDPESAVSVDEDLALSELHKQVLGLTEVTVTRRYYRSGESEYLINRQPCRLRDITELFLGTGAGTKAYSIIEQGRVEQLINAKPEDRRWFIEEAAGTTLYRTRKVAAERKMERTRENLLRVSDILREVERQIQYLHRQAKKAEQYRNVQAEIRAIDLTLARAQWRALCSDREGIERALEEIERDQRDVTVAIEVAASDRGVAHQAISQAEQQLGAWREQAAHLRAQTEALRQRRDWIDGQRQERLRRQEKLVAEAASLEDRASRLVNEAAEIDREHAFQAEALLREDTAVQELFAQVETRRAAVSAGEAESESIKDKLVGILAEASDLRNRLLASQRHGGEAARRVERLEADEREALDHLTSLDHDLQGMRQSVEDLNRRLSQLRGERDDRSQRLRTIAEERHELDERMSAAQGQLLQVRSRLQSIEEIQRNYEGYERGVRSIMVPQPAPSAGVLGVVADVISAPQQYERAVAAALGERLQYVIVAGTDQALDAVRALRDGDCGRGSFIPQAPRKLPLNPSGIASLNGSSRPLLDVVKIREGYRELAEQLLGEVVLVPDLDTALSLWRSNGVYVTMVTPQGDVLDASGVVTGGSDRPVEEEILTRRREIEELEAGIDRLTTELDHAGATRARLSASEAAEGAALKQLDAGVHQLTVDLLTGEKDLERLEADRPRWVERMSVARLDMEALANEESARRLEGEQLEGALLERQNAQSWLEREVQEGQSATLQLKLELDGVLERLTAARVRLAEARERQISLSSRRENIDRQLADVQRHRSDLENEKAEASAAGERLAGEASEVEELLQHARGEIDAIEVTISAGMTEVGALQKNVEAADAKVNDLRESMESLRDRRSASETALAERRLRREHLTETTREKYALELAVEVDTHADEAEPDPALPSRLEDLRARLARIGEVNVGAIEELQELEERARFLRTQKEDLERSLEDLERTISKLNRASRARFRETFDQVDQKFRTVFPRLFRGGEARLMLTDESNILESGVEIFVRPPGKKLDTVTLLSGGEKALVAVSLIFALFLIRPTPFCFLDEIDAPLDDANVGRFVQMVREISDQTQFILITHNKRTMEAADCLYGVTMEEPGVSKVISVAMR